MNRALGLSSDSSASAGSVATSPKTTFAPCSAGVRVLFHTFNTKEENSRHSCWTVDRPIPVAPPVNTTTLSARVLSSEGSS